MAFHGLSKKITSNASHANHRLHYELNVIDELGFSNYFLIVWDIIMEAKWRRIITIGRGSVADSLVAYALDFTQVDTIKHNLYFERFLNRGRKSPPDIDIDFSWRERDEMIRYVFDKYGYEKVAMIITQLDMYSIEDIGLMKIDLLSQRALGVLRDTIRDI
ncbi:MAG: hypothetical protein L3J41_02455 [Melioribacteraceae bacterium]|nr:hypothetical protein [Melioribacteraceae bacterium]